MGDGGKDGQGFVAEASSRATRSNLFYSRVYPQFTPGSVACCSQEILVRATAGSCREGALIVQPRPLGSKVIISADVAYSGVTHIQGLP